MLKRCYWCGLALILTLALISVSQAGESKHGKHEHHGEKKDHGHGQKGHHGEKEGHGHGDKGHHGEKEGHGHDDKGHHGEKKDHHGGHGHHAHRHDKWEPAPAKYANMSSDRWTNQAAIARGKQLFKTNCELCHGADGQGTGPGAKGLEHPPADLTNHFHMKPGDGDAYLFWRVSEGGFVEPFKSMKSAMPAFKSVLSEDQRWDVLAYVHRIGKCIFRFQKSP